MGKGLAMGLAKQALANPCLALILLAFPRDLEAHVFDKHLHVVPG
jgi:hypothetical protein